MVQAESCSDEAEAESMREVGLQEAKAWNCPSLCKDGKVELSSSQLQSFRAIKRLTKLNIIQDSKDGSSCNVELETCPYRYFSMEENFGQEAMRVYRAMDWKDKSQFAVIEEPTYSMIQAIEIMEGGFSAARAHNQKRQNEEAERERKKWLEKMDGKVSS